MWKNDQEFNRLLNQRRYFSKHDVEYKTITKAVKKRIKHLRKEKLSKETDEISENANRRQVEKLNQSIQNNT